MDDEMAQGSSQVTTLRDLKRLSVADNPDLGIEGIACLLEAEFAPRLEALAVGCGWFDDDLVGQLAESRLSSTVRLSMKHGFRSASLTRALAYPSARRIVTVCVPNR